MDIYIKDNKYIACLFILFCLVFGGMYLKAKYYDHKVDKAKQEVLTKELNMLLKSKLLQGSKNVNFNENGGSVTVTTDCSSYDNRKIIESRGEEWLLKNGWIKKQGLLFQKEGKILKIKFAPKNELKIPKEMTRWKIMLEYNHHN